jgi:pyruvate dehydrogenase E2 component (dihydrolipoamide acetyltransferase)
MQATTRSHRLGRAAYGDDSVSEVVDVRLPGLPDCWESCGNCSDGGLTVVEVRVRPGDRVGADDPALVVETDKVTLDLPTERAGRVVEVLVAVGDRVTAGQLLLRLEPQPPAGAGG